METQIVIGIEALKDKYREAKLRAGDMRGLGHINRLALAEKFNINKMQIAFDTISPYFTKRGKIEVSISLSVGSQDYGGVYNLKDLLNEVADILRFEGDDAEIEINFEKVLWNVRGTDAQRSTIGSSFIYKNK